jgi:hypothetical protein
MWLLVSLLSLEVSWSVKCGDVPTRTFSEGGLMKSNSNQVDKNLLLGGRTVGMYLAKPNPCSTMVDNGVLLRKVLAVSQFYCVVDICAVRVLAMGANCRCPDRLVGRRCALPEHRENPDPGLQGLVFGVRRHLSSRAFALRVVCDVVILYLSQRCTCWMRRISTERARCIQVRQLVRVLHTTHRAQYGCRFC